jgi:hypothetical protein
VSSEVGVAALLDGSPDLGGGVLDGSPDEGGGVAVAKAGCSPAEGGGVAGGATTA